MSKKTTFNDTRFYDEEYMECIQDLISHEEVRSLEKMKHHMKIDRLQHCLSVSYKSYRICKRLGFDYTSAARGGLLHDFFLYDCDTKEKMYTGFHGSAHPKIALENAKKHFELNDLEMDIIVKHMWPVTISLPKCKESWVVTAMDKYCAVLEFFNAHNRISVDDLMPLKIEVE